MAIVLPELAKRLLDRWKRSPELKGDRKSLLFTEEIFPETTLANGLALLATFEESLMTLLKKADDASDVVLEDVEAAIANFQSQNQLLHKDGVLGIKTLSELLKAMGCPTILKTPKEELSDAAKDHLTSRREQDGRHWYFYFVEDLPNVQGASSRALLNRAWAQWMKFAGFRAQPLRENERELANVVIRPTVLPGNVLGRAHVGNPPGAFSLLELEIDDRLWEPRLFFNAVCHEIGHVIGIDHTSPGFLMSEIIPNDQVLGPTEHDIQLAQRLHGPPPT